MPVEVMKTELSIEPIRADSVTFLRTQERILHLEFQVEVGTEPPLPLRMLDYWVRLYRRYRLPISQVLILLKPTPSAAAAQNYFQVEETQHRFEIIRMWEQDPEPLLQDSALLPLGVLAATEEPIQLLARVAAQVSKIEEQTKRQEVSACAQVLAGLQFRAELIRQVFREGVMRESVIYQEIVKEGLEEGLQQGLQKGLQQGKQEEALAYTIRLLTRRIGTVPSELQEQIQELSISQLEELGEALLAFSNASDLVDYLQTHQ